MEEASGGIGSGIIANNYLIFSSFSIGFDLKFVFVLLVFLFLVHIESLQKMLRKGGGGGA